MPSALGQVLQEEWVEEGGATKKWAVLSETTAVWYMHTSVHTVTHSAIQ